MVAGKLQVPDYFEASRMVAGKPLGHIVLDIVVNMAVARCIAAVQIADMLVVVSYPVQADRPAQVVLAVGLFHSCIVEPAVLESRADRKTEWQG